MSLARRCGWNVWSFRDSRREVRDRTTGERKFVGDRDAEGWPDLTLAHPGRGIILFRELKVPPNDLTDAQRICLTTLKACGMDAAVWRPADMPGITATLTRSRRNPQ